MSSLFQLASCSSLSLSVSFFFLSVVGLQWAWEVYHDIDFFIGISPISVSLFNGIRLSLLLTFSFFQIPFVVVQALWGEQVQYVPPNRLSPSRNHYLLL